MDLKKIKKTYSKTTKRVSATKCDSTTKRDSPTKSLLKNTKTLLRSAQINKVYDDLTIPAPQANQPWHDSFLEESIFVPPQDSQGTITPPTDSTLDLATLDTLFPPLPPISTQSYQLDTQPATSWAPPVPLLDFKSIIPSSRNKPHNN